VAEIRRGGAENAADCDDLTRLLPDHFSENVPDEVRRGRGAARRVGRRRRPAGGVVRRG
jgi:hypothetical protein